jgi:hypothetical protein
VKVFVPGKDVIFLICQKYLEKPPGIKITAPLAEDIFFPSIVYLSHIIWIVKLEPKALHQSKINDHFRRPTAEHSNPVHGRT